MSRPPPARVRDIIALHALVLLNSFASVIAKTLSREQFLSWRFVRLYAVEMAIIVGYAFCWQKIIRRFDISVAYANTGIGIAWVMLWALLFFGEPVRPANLFGTAIIIGGIFLVFRNAK
ncbi:transporter [candidate division WOR-3 bacterium]|nr:transporter [candidate division WOR-3 bacterium]